MTYTVERVLGRGATWEAAFADADAAGEGNFRHQRMIDQVEGHSAGLSGRHRLQAADGLDGDLEHGGEVE